MPINSPSLSLPTPTSGGASMARAAGLASAAAGDESPDNPGFQAVLDGQTARAGGDAQQPQLAPPAGFAALSPASTVLPAEGSGLPGAGMELPLATGEVPASAPATAQLIAMVDSSDMPAAEPAKWPHTENADLSSVEPARLSATEHGELSPAEPAIADLLAWLAGGKRTSVGAAETAKLSTSGDDATAEADTGATEAPVLLATGSGMPPAQPQLPPAVARSDRTPVEAGLLPTGTGSSPTARVAAALPEATPDAMPAPAGDPAPAAVATKASGAFEQLVQTLDREAAGDVVESGSEPGPQVLREPAGRTTAAVQGMAPNAALAASSSAQIQVPVGRQGWSEAVLEKVMWFSSQLIDSAEIQLSPPELGPVQVRISTQHEQASVYFASHNAAVREALDQTLPRLRELFESQGLQLADAAVGERGFADERATQQERGSGQGRALDDNSDGNVEVPLPTVNVRRGLLDAYA